MSSPTQARPVVTLYPSSQEDVNAYMAAIRLASSVRNSMDAEKPAVNADSYGRHHHNFSRPISANLTTPRRHGPVPILNETSSANFISNTTKPGFVHPRDSQLSSSSPMSTGTWDLIDTHASAPAAELFTLVDTPTSATLEALKPHQGYFPPPDPPMSTGDSPILKAIAADTPNSVNVEALERHHGYFPPPEPPIGSTQAPSGKPILRRTGPIPINDNHGPNGIKWYVPGDIPPQCQLYAANTETNNDTFAVCPVTKRNADPTHNSASVQLYTGDISQSYVLATRDTAMCEAPTGFEQRLACGRLDVWFVLAFFILFSIIGFAWMTRRGYKTRQLDEENGTATWPRLSNVPTNYSEAKAKPRASKVPTNSSEAKLREKTRKAHEKDQRLDEELSTKQYEPVAWRSSSHRAARANVEGSVRHDAGPVAVLPNSFEDLPAHTPFLPLPLFLDRNSTGLLG